MLLPLLQLLVVGALVLKVLFRLSRLHSLLLFFAPNLDAFDDVQLFEVFSDVKFAVF